ncbi:hypothetical protein [Spirosoma endbachense]|uniref:Uncharacterized protein n=1 Tax=Spirosoma endbachense TaxID=2666025 RepID=A0A6P1VYU5_9BACT|nr:hypothetical protein [Spirosoma endbachense]QHV96937.1 hypothetical protein GJR95_18835 [Spirosoma endbachense]
MNRTVTYLLGPELVWLLLLALAGILVAQNQPVTGMSHLKIIWLNWYLPAIGVMLAFVPLFWATGNLWWWLVRIGLASLIGVVLLVGYLCKSASYSDIRDLGVGMGFLFFVAIGWTLLASIGLIAILFQLANWSFLPALKCLLVLFSLFLLVMKFKWDNP